MIVMTVVMIVFLLSLTPLRIAVAFRLDVDEKSVRIEGTVFWIPVIKENFSLHGKYLHCEGTVNAEVNLFSVDGRSGVDVAKAVVVDSLNVTAAVDYSKYGAMTLPAVETLLCLSTAVACACSHCKIHASTCFSLENAVFGEVVVSVSLADVLAVMLKDSIRKRKQSQ